MSCSRVLEITNRRGLHARASAKFVTMAAELPAKVEVEKDGNRVCGTSIMELMMLGAAMGDTITLHCDGEGCGDALDRLKAAKPKATADGLIRSLKPNQRLLLVEPIIRSARWGAPWTKLVRTRAGQWQKLLDRDKRISRVLAAPHLNGRRPKGVRLVLYQKL